MWKNKATVSSSVLLFPPKDLSHRILSKHLFGDKDTDWHQGVFKKSHATLSLLAQYETRTVTGAACGNSSAALRSGRQAWGQMHLLVLVTTHRTCEQPERADGGQ